MSGEYSGITGVVLAGGLGTRLRSLVADRPKVLAEINGRPFLAYLLDRFATAGVKNVVICSGYLAEQISAAFGQSYRGMSIRYSVESSQLGTGGALRLALPLLDSDLLLVANGDSFFDADLEAFYTSHQESGAAVSLLLAHVEDISRFGAVDIAADGSVARFEEKGTASGSGLINAGIYLVRRALIAKISSVKPVSLEREIFPGLLGNDLYGFPQVGKFIDIGTPADYEAAADFFQHLTDFNLKEQA